MAEAQTSAAFNRIKAKHIDFTLIDPHGMPRLLVEVDDGSHTRADRRKRDAFVDAALAEAGLNLVRVSPDGRTGGRRR